MENLPIKTFDVLSFTGLIALVPFLLEGLKKLLKSAITGRESWACMILCYGIGVPVKFFTPLAYNGVTGPMGWITTIIGLFLCGVAAMTVHDNVLAKMFGWRDDVLSKPPAPGGGQSGRVLLPALTALLFVVASIATTVGCANAGTKTLANGFEGSTKQIFKEYEDFVIEGKPRPAYNDSDKKIRRDSLAEVRKLIEQGKQ